MLSVKQGVSSIIFQVFGMARPGVEPSSPGPLILTKKIAGLNNLTDAGANLITKKMCIL